MWDVGSPHDLSLHGSQSDPTIYMMLHGVTQQRIKILKVNLHGCTLALALSENNLSEICQVMKEKGLGSRIALQRSTVEERLCVMKFWR
jgi:hypothetical protein